MRSLFLNLSETKRYALNIGIDLLALNQSEWQKWLKDSRVCIITNQTIEPIYGTLLKENLQSFGFETSLVAIADGEKYKTLATASKLFDYLIEQNFNRQSTIIALGGGVIGDLAGFVAATFMRGIHLIQIPTTLLAQVDSSVGGKTAVNHPLGKNMIGSFYQPEVVLIDPKFLKSLPDREFFSGFAEVIKYALMMDVSFFQWLGKNNQLLIDKEKNALIYAITTSCNSKAKIVQKDEKEAGVRALLNLGHTFAHAIESSLGYGTWLHGEAVALGMIWAAEFSQSLGHLSDSEVNKIISLIKSFNLPTQLDQAIDMETFINHLLHDKKFENDKIRLILLKNIGEAYIEEGVQLEQLSEFLEPRLKFNSCKHI